MAEMTIEQLSEKMRDIDFCMLTTISDGGLAARPMSNNREVAFDGDCFFFSDGDSRTVKDLERDPTAGLSFQGSGGLMGVVGKPGIFIAIEGKGELIRDKAQFEKRWQKGLERWWPQGIDTPGLTLIKVKADRVHYWDGGDEGEVKLTSA
ncbi:pyridoxamine 5'-phosphate oxidase family protein [Sphingomonas sinipercae]|uniref:Pyridoxamine 5'-phosphate oxidase family protein n=1 Tax=Sphingomonas sinipercae TaxID=2714944 RepID=A0A6G7ZKV5_9SPHN|nr:pyridoxamine 5'-phosphate oxidase family protein [Sphingomonas sinipercae]QIL01614.1 pyridoxamine 5'-phosphate oxidase family protein [Sphingomonas sinipercae]